MTILARKLLIWPWSLDSGRNDRFLSQNDHNMLNFRFFVFIFVFSASKYIELLGPSHGGAQQLEQCFSSDPINEYKSCKASNKHCLTVSNSLLIPFDSKGFGYYSRGKFRIPDIHHCKRIRFHYVIENYSIFLDEFCCSVPEWMQG